MNSLELWFELGKKIKSIGAEVRLTKNQMTGNRNFYFSNWILQNNRLFGGGGGERKSDSLSESKVKLYQRDRFQGLWGWPENFCRRQRDFFCWESAKVLLKLVLLPWLKQISQICEITVYFNSKIFSKNQRSMIFI